MATNQAAKLKVLQQAFVKADKDGDSLLNKDEFKEFVKIGYQKPCPNGMYEGLCQHFGRDEDVGIDWNTARTVWLQAQAGPTKAKTPQPPKPQNGTTQSNTSQSPAQNIKQAFIHCDQDGDGLLNKQEFTEFVKVGFKKPSVPNGMYEQVCGHFKKDPNAGIDWLSAFALWKQSNPNAPNAPNATQTSPNKKTNTSSKKKPPNLKRLNTVSTITRQKSNGTKTPKGKMPKMGQLSPTKSTGQLYAKHQSRESYSGSGSALTERNLRALETNTGYHAKSMNDDEHSVDSDRSYRSSQNTRRNRRIGSTSRGNGSFDDGVDATQMVVQMMETKVKNLQNQLKLERTKRKKTEELAQSLLTQNEEYKKQIGDLSSVSSKAKSENKTMKEQLRKLKQIVDDDRNTIKHLKEQRNAKKSERDEAYGLLTKVEKEHAAMIKKEKQKHKEQMEKLSAGFLQSLGAEPGKDITTVIRELKNHNVDLSRRVDELAATLARKNESLVHALKAVDNLAMVDEMNQMNEYAQAQMLMNEVQPNTQRNNKGKMKSKLKSLNQRRKSFVNKNNNNNNNNNSSDSDGGISGLPKPPKRRNSQIGIKPHHRPTATFFKRAVGDKTAGKKKLNLSNAKNGKELQFVSQQLTSDVANKTQSIQNLEMANTALMEQMQKMQKQMENMKTGQSNNANNKEKNNHKNQESNASISDLP